MRGEQARCASALPRGGARGARAQARQRAKLQEGSRRESERHKQRSSSSGHAEEHAEDRGTEALVAPRVGDKEGELRFGRRAKAFIARMAPKARRHGRYDPVEYGTCDADGMGGCSMGENGLAPNGAIWAEERNRRRRCAPRHHPPPLPPRRRAAIEPPARATPTCASGAPVPSVRAGDWTCASKGCPNVFASKTRCFRCGRAYPPTRRSGRSDTLRRRALAYIRAGPGRRGPRQAGGGGT